MGIAETGQGGVDVPLRSGLVKPERGRGSVLARGVRKLALASVMMGLASAATASVTVTDLLFNPTHMGKTQTTDVTVKWTNDNTAAGSFTVPVPAHFSVENAGPCTFASSTLTCPTSAGATGETDQLSFTLKAEQISTANLTATGVESSSGTATATYYIQASGAVTVTKEKTSPASDPVAGEEITFEVKPQVLSGDPIPAGATIVVTDKLPATAAEFEYVSHSAAGVTPAPLCAHNAGDHEVVCTYTAPAGGWTLAQLNSATITVKGKALIAGDNLKNEAVVHVDPNNGYVDLTLNDNTDDVEFNSINGGDLIADGSFPSVPVDVGSNHNLTIIYKNDGPLDATGNGTVSTIIPVDFTIGDLPDGCTNAGNGTIDGISGTRIDCTATDIAKSNQTSFHIPLTMPATPGTGNFPVLVTPPPGYTDYKEPNNLKPVPYNVVDPFSDLGLSKSKTPGGGRKRLALPLPTVSPSPTAVTAPKRLPLAAAMVRCVWWIGCGRKKLRQGRQRLLQDGNVRSTLETILIPIATLRGHSALSAKPPALGLWPLAPRPR